LPIDRTVQTDFSPLEDWLCFMRSRAFGFLFIFILASFGVSLAAFGQDGMEVTAPRNSADIAGTSDSAPAFEKGLIFQTVAPVEAVGPAEADSNSAGLGRAPTTAQSKAPVDSELIFEGLASYGHYKIFASGSDCKLYTAGVEYDRHSWGSFLKARVDYVAEFLPVVLLDAPLTQDIWGTPTSPYRHIVPGIGIAPIGFRLLWRDHKGIMPYLEAKGGMLGFTQKALSQEASYEDFSLQTVTGVKVKMNERFDLRLGLFGDFHFSNGFIVPVDPGLDVMNASLGLVYHLGARKE
jgi:hypothetical protein